MTITNQQIVNYTTQMKGYYIANYFEDVKLLNSFFGIRTEVIPQSTLLSYELKELRTLQSSVNKLVRQAAFDRLNALRKEAFQAQQRMYAARS